MRAVRSLPIVVVVAVACGNAGGSPIGAGDYYTQLERISQNAQIQQRGLLREQRLRVERASTPAERLAAIEVTLDQRVRLYEDVTDALTSVRPIEGLSAAHDAYAEAWTALLELTKKVRDSGIRTVPKFLQTLDAEAFHDAEDDVRRTCEDLHSIAAAADRAVDLACGGRPG